MSEQIICNHGDLFWECPKCNEGRASGSLERSVRLQGVRVKLKNRRVYAALGPDKHVWLRLVKLDGKKRKVTSLRLTTDAAAATASAIIATLNEAMRNDTGKQPNTELCGERGASPH